MKNAIVLIMYKPKDNVLDFYNQLKEYDVYVIIDDEATEYKNTQSPYLTYIQISSIKCLECGITDICPIRNSNRITKYISGWDKAVYFSIYDISDKYEYIWLVEDDVFIPHERTLLNIDKKYPDTDLVSNSPFTTCNDMNKWHWKLFKDKIHYSLPYYNGMMCILRLSRSMLQYLQQYTLEHKTLFYLEALFPTVAMKNNLRIVKSPIELGNIVFRKNWNARSINPNQLYHPVKGNHKEFRKFIDLNKLC